MNIVIWLDDIRDPHSCSRRDFFEAFYPDMDKVIWAKNFEEFISIFDEITSSDDNLIGVCFDNDLGHNSLEGRQCFTWMEEQIHLRNLPQFELYAQTANPAAKKELQAGFSALDRYWNSKE